VSEQRDEVPAPTWRPWTIDELARSQDAQTVADPGDLADDIWSSDEELDAFLSDLRASRNSSAA
jgi:hypothetical protein